MYTSSPAHGEEVYHDLSYITLSHLQFYLLLSKSINITQSLVKWI